MQECPLPSHRLWDSRGRMNSDDTQQRDELMIIVLRGVRSGASCPLLRHRGCPYFGTGGPITPAGLIHRGRASTVQSMMRTVSTGSDDHQIRCTRSNRLAIMWPSQVISRDWGACNLLKRMVDKSSRNCWYRHPIVHPGDRQTKELESKVSIACQPSSGPERSGHLNR